MKRLIGLFACATIVLSGCCKKREVSAEKKTVAANTTEVAGYLYDNDVLAESGELAFLNETSADGIESALTWADDSDFLAETANDYKLSWSQEAPEALAFEPVRFYFDSDKLAQDQANKDALHRNVESAKRAVESGRKLVINAYADQIGTEKYNLALTQRRGNVMKQSYVKAGVPAEAIEVVARGQEKPLVASNATERIKRIHELSPNRRAEITVISSAVVAQSGEAKDASDLAAVAA